MFDNKNILITGGTGSFGTSAISLIRQSFKPNKIIVFSRDELKQFNMEKLWPGGKNSIMRYFIGDVRDLERLHRAMEGVDIVIHAAALKQVPTSEYNPFEVVKTNVFGAQNVIEASIANKVKRIVALSTDKAAAPVNLYGATKLTSDKLFISANNYLGGKNIKFSVVRYGNVMGSRGSVIPLFLEQKKNGLLKITDKRMTRFNITLKQSVEFVIRSINMMWGGEIFVPKIPSYRILDLATAIAPDCPREFIGIRPGEKISEEMITKTESVNCMEFSDYFVISPTTPLWDEEKFCLESNKVKGRKNKKMFSYNSDNNQEFLAVKELEHLIAKNIFNYKVS